VTPPAAPPRALTVIVVAYGEPGDLAACLEGLGGRFAVTVVDNSSSPATRAVVEGAGAEYVDPGTNLGFAAAVNTALGRADLRSGDVLLLNPDAVVTPAVVERLVASLAGAPDVACAAPAQHRPGTSAPATVRWPFPTPRAAWAEAVGLGRFLGDDGYVIASVLAVAGGALLDVGGLDEGFFLYAEEADWERRATRRGWRVAYCPEVEATHRGAATDEDPERRRVRFHAGVETYVRKWHGAAGWRSYQAATVLTALRRALLTGSSARRRSSLALARLYAAGPRAVAGRAGFVPERSHHVPALGAPR